LIVTSGFCPEVNWGFSMSGLAPGEAAGSDSAKTPKEQTLRRIIKPISFFMPALPFLMTN
jgi:hypothetical protein